MTRRHDSSGMRIIALASGKGGVGKSSLSCWLAVEADRNGLASLVLDLDPQGSARDWGAWRSKHAGPGRRPLFDEADASTLKDLLQAARRSGIRYVALDCPSGLGPETRAAWGYAQALFLPMRPARLDGLAVVDAVERSRAEWPHLPIGLIVNQAMPSRTGLFRSSREFEFVRSMREHAAVCPMPIGLRRAAVEEAGLRGLTPGEHAPKSALAREIRSVWRWTLSDPPRYGTA